MSYSNSVKTHMCSQPIDDFVALWMALTIRRDLAGLGFHFGGLWVQLCVPRNYFWYFCCSGTGNGWGGTQKGIQLRAFPMTFSKTSGNIWRCLLEFVLVLFQLVYFDVVQVPRVTWEWYLSFSGEGPGGGKLHLDCAGCSGLRFRPYRKHVAAWLRAYFFGAVCETACFDFAWIRNPIWKTVGITLTPNW